MPCDLDVLLAPLFGELGQHHADDCAVVSGVDSKIGVADRPLNRAERGLVVGRHHGHARLGHLEGRELIHGRGRSVVVDEDLREHSRVGPTGADRGEVVLGHRDGLVHLLFGLKEGFVDHGCSSRECVRDWSAVTLKTSRT